jgi:hypothetical protein
MTQAIIAGGRDYVLTKADYHWLDDLLVELELTEVVHGDYGKTDKAAGRWGNFHQLKVTPFPPDPKRWPSAGPIRNTAMSKYVRPDGVLITFPGGAGTADMIRKAKSRGLRHIQREVSK